MDFNFDEAYKIPLLCMKINKCHPSIKRDKKWFLYFILSYSIFTFNFLIAVHNIIFINLKNKEFDVTCKNGVLFVVYIVISFQYFTMIWKQDVILYLITTMKKDYELAKTLHVSEQKIMYKFIKKGVFVCELWFIMCFLGSICFPVKNIVLMIKFWANGEPKLIPMYDLVYPAFIQENINNIYVFLIVYASIFFYCCYSSCMYVASVPVGPIFMLHACGQLEIVEKKIGVLFEGDLEDAEHKLKEIIKQLQYIYDFVEQILASFRVNYEFILKATTLILPITCYEVIEAFQDGEVPLEFITFIIGGVLIGSTPCYYSDLLMEKSENVRIAMYSCGWESVYNNRIRSTVLLLLIRALKPVAIRTHFRIICLEALTDLFQQSYAIFNLMNAMWN